MIIAGRYSFNRGEEYIRSKHQDLLKEVEEIILAIDAESCRLKKPRGQEASRLVRIGETRFYSPTHINAVFEALFSNRGWTVHPRINTRDQTRDGYREMDFVKNGLGVEVQIGKYAFLTYDIVAKMPIFRNLGVIECGIEICPMSSMLPHMSTGIGSFEQVRWDLDYRGSFENDVPVLLLGFETEKVASPRTETYSDEYAAYSSSQPVLVETQLSDIRPSTRRLCEETGLYLTGE